MSIFRQFSSLTWYLGTRFPSAMLLRGFQTTLPISNSVAHLPSPPPLTSLTSPEDNALAQTWVTKFEQLKIPKSLVELSFSRSSGPGGQNVNKLNTKATLRCSLDSLWIPLWAKSELQKNPHYVASSRSILITSSLQRSQAQNIEQCLSKLHAIVQAAASALIKQEPSKAQQEKVDKLMKAEKTRKKIQKAHRSAVKSGRSNFGGWD